MNFKTLLLTTISTAICLSAIAQDKLYKKNGDMVEVKVTEITGRTISYKRVDNTDGPTYTINKAEVAKIVYPNGSEDYFGEADAKRTNSGKKPMKYGHNIVSIIPMQLLTEGVGIGLSYERVIDKGGILSFYLPVAASLTQPTSNAGNPPGTTTTTKPIYYFMPGLKFYPTGSKGIVRYAVGPNLTYLTGERYDFRYDNMGNIVGVGWQQRSALGIMVTNSLNINPNTHIHLGMELGLGFTYMNRLAGVDMGTEALVQFGFKIGYRF